MAAQRPSRPRVRRLADRPGGTPAERVASAEVYGAEEVHDFARRAILDALALGPADQMLELGCGCGLLLRTALTAGAPNPLILL